MIHAVSTHGVTVIIVMGLVRSKESTEKSSMTGCIDEGGTMTMIPRKMMAVIRESDGGDGCGHSIGCGILVVHQRDGESDSDFIVRVRDPEEYSDINGKTHTLSYEFYIAQPANVTAIRHVVRYEVDYE